KEYWDVMREFPILQGGFIWDFADQSLRWPIPLGGGASYLAYGGDWGDDPNDGNFCANGVVSAERETGGKAAEVKRIHQAINVAPDTGIAEGFVRIVNEYLFTDVAEFDCEWALLADGEVVQSGELTAEQLEIPPLSEKTVQVP